MNQKQFFLRLRIVAEILSQNPKMIADIASRFIVNLPDSELRSFDRLLYHLQCASWFYNDHLRFQYNTRYLSTRRFCHMMFSTSDILRPYLSQFDRLYTAFVDYMNNIPVFGCMIWSPCRTHVLLVRGPTGYWSFPKGKRDQDECGLDCARREVLEETGFDVRPFLHKDSVSVTRHVYNRILTMYDVVALDMFPIIHENRDTTEVTDIRWVQVDQITSRNRYPTVLPFL